jgi:hypothetical protein
MTYRRFHWRLVNIGGRVLGIGFALAGTFGLLQIIFVDTPPGSDFVLFLVVCIFALVVGVLALLAKPERPDLESHSGEPQMTAARDYTWWTGEPK